MDTFVAIELRTARPARHTACAIALVNVVKGVIIQKYFTRIQPPGNKYDSHTVDVNGLNAELTENAPYFPEIFPLLKIKIEGNNVVCLNARFNISVLKSTMEYYGIDSNDLSYRVFDEIKLFGHKLIKFQFREYRNKLILNDPLLDAETCARIFLKYHRA